MPSALRAVYITDRTPAELSPPSKATKVAVAGPTLAARAASVIVAPPTAEAVDTVPKATVSTSKARLVPVVVA